MPSITVDPRAGSKDLVPYLRALGVPVEEEQNSFGDIYFVGNGPDGPEPVGIEHKKINDVLDCIHGGRYAGYQLEGLRDTFPTFVFLLVEGKWGSTKDGRLLVNGSPKVWRGRNGFERQWMYRDVTHWLWTMQFKGGIPWLQAKDHDGSAKLIKTLFTWFTSKKWDEHESLNVVYNPVSRRIGSTRPTYRRRVASVLPGIGWTRSKAIEEHFKNVEDMILAPMSEWAELEGIGEITARKVRNAIVGRG